MSNGAMRRATWLPVLLVIVFVIVLQLLGAAAGSRWARGGTRAGRLEKTVRLLKIVGGSLRLERAQGQSITNG